MKNFWPRMLTGHDELTYTNIVYLLDKACADDIASRGGELQRTEEYKLQVTKMAELLCLPHKTFGMLLRGGMGNGKSTLLRALSMLASNLTLHGFDVYEHAKFVYKTAIQIFDMYTNDHEGFNELKAVTHLIIDEVGVEPAELNYFGCQVQPVKELLYARYDEFKYTVLGTNLSMKGLAEKYDDQRLTDRLKEMYPQERWIVFTAQTFRGRK